MTHDPMCVMTDPPHGGCHACELIARVRADERERAAERVAELGCNDECGCRISIPAAIAAARGGDA